MRNNFFSNTDHNRGNTSNMHKYLITQHIINLYGCNVFDMLLRDGGDSQSGAKENG